MRQSERDVVLYTSLGQALVPALNDQRGTPEISLQEQHLGSEHCIVVKEGNKYIYIK